jgi:cytochrome c553
MRTIVGAMVLAFAATGALAQGSEVKGDSERGRQKVSMCVGCHGIPDYRTAYPIVYHVPMIAGQTPGYIVKALEAYRSGDRNHPTMRGIAASLSDQDMADIAVYYSAPQK